MFDRELNGRVAKAELSVYDGILAEIMGEKDARVRKFERTHHADNSKKDETKADRKRNKMCRMRKMYGLSAFEDTKLGKTVFYWDVKGGQKKFPEYEAEILRNLKDAEKEKSAYAELIPDAEHHVGKTTLTKVMNRTYARMQKIAHDFCDQNGYTWGEMWAYDPNDHYYHVGYPDEYYRVRSEYMELREECDERFIRKMQKGGCY